MNMKLIPWLALGVAALALPAVAQQPAKKLYCWDDKGSRVCSDALPPDAVNRARDEINSKSGLRTASVAAPQTEAERAAAQAANALAEAQRRAAQLREISDQGLLQNFGSEEKLQRVFNERRQQLDDNVRMGEYNLTSLRSGLIALLNQASTRELAGKPVAEPLLADIRARHAELSRQQMLLAGFARERTALDGEIAATLSRYRQLKAAGTAATAEAPQGVAPTHQ